MADHHHHRRLDEQIAQEEQALTDDPSFLQEIVQKALQQILQAEMSAHVGAPLLTSAAKAARVSATATSRGRLKPGWGP